MMGEHKIKYCRFCGTNKNDTEFSFKYKKRGIRHGRCKACQSEYARQHYQDNRPMYIAKAQRINKKHRKKLRGILDAYLLKHPCVDCGEGNTIVLEFDHVRGTKKHNISNMCRVAYSWRTIMLEIKKCEVRCANCHRIRHNKNRNPKGIRKCRKKR